jgi:hypothetical protein
LRTERPSTHLVAFNIGNSHHLCFEQRVHGPLG